MLTYFVFILKVKLPMLKHTNSVSYIKMLEDNSRIMFAFTIVTKHYLLQKN